MKLSAIKNYILLAILVRSSEAAIIFNLRNHQINNSNVSSTTSNVGESLETRLHDSQMSSGGIDDKEIVQLEQELEKEFNIFKLFLEQVEQKWQTRQHSISSRQQREPESSLTTPEEPQQPARIFWPIISTPSLSSLTSMFNFNSNNADDNSDTVDDDNEEDEIEENFAEDEIASELRFLLSNVTEPSDLRFMWINTLDQQAKNRTRRVANAGANVAAYINQMLQMITNRLTNLGFHTTGVSIECRERTICDTAQFITSRMPAFAFQLGRDKLFQLPVTTFGNSEYINAWVVGLTMRNENFCDDLYSCDEEDLLELVGVNNEADEDKNITTASMTENTDVKAI